MLLLFNILTEHIHQRACVRVRGVSVSVGGYVYSMCVYINTSGYKKIIICCRNMVNNEAILLLFFFSFALLPGCLCLAKSETIPGLQPHKALTG